MTFIDFIFFLYMFLGLYMTFLFIFIYLENRKTLFHFPLGSIEPVSIVMPCYNASKTIGKAIEALMTIDYPKNMFEVIIVDDKSKDNSVEVVQSYLKRYSNLRLFVNTRNSGGAAEPTNIGIRHARYDYIAVADDDSMPDRDALKKMIGFLQEDPKVAAVTCSVLVHAPSTFLQRLQAIEYAVIAWTRKLLDYVGGVYVTPGPFALYRKKALLEVGLFDTTNMTQDIEIVWRLLSHGYMARMCLGARVHTVAPTKLRAWWRQRIRWDIGGIQTLIKYRSYVFRKGMLGLFVIPLFAVSFFLGLFGLGIFLYLFLRRIIFGYLVTNYSLYGGTELLRLETLSFSPSVLNFFGGALFLLGIWFTIFSLRSMNSSYAGRTKIFNLILYMTVYLALYPIVLVSAIIQMARGRYSW